MPIQRQNESYGAFDDGSHRFARDHAETRDLPEGLVNMLAGPRISAGLNNPRAYRQAVDTHGMDPAGHAYHTEAPFDPHDSQRGARDYDPNTGYQPSPYDEQQSELVGQDDDSGYNWGPQPSHADFAENLVPAAGGDVQGFGVGGYDDFDPHSGDNVDARFAHQAHMASFTEARRLTADDGPAQKTAGITCPQCGNEAGGHGTVAECPWCGWKDSLGGDDSPISPDEHSDIMKALYPRGRGAAAVQPQVVPGWVGHGYTPGHRVGLPWREQVIPGTVTHLPGQQVGVRWDDGQHSTEEPSDLRPL